MSLLTGATPVAPFPLPKPCGLHQMHTTIGRMPLHLLKHVQTPDFCHNLVLLLYDRILRATCCLTKIFVNLLWEQVEFRFLQMNKWCFFFFVFHDHSSYSSNSSAEQGWNTVQPSWWGGQIRSITRSELLWDRSSPCLLLKTHHFPKKMSVFHLTES